MAQPYGSRPTVQRSALEVLHNTPAPILNRSASSLKLPQPQKVHSRHLRIAKEHQFSENLITGNMDEMQANEHIRVVAR
jgi:hypothetical protein